MVLYLCMKVDITVRLSNYHDKNNNSLLHIDIRLIAYL